LVKPACPLGYIKKNLFNPKIVRFSRDYFMYKVNLRHISVPAVYQALLSKQCKCIESYHREHQNPRYLLVGWQKRPFKPLHMVVEVVQYDPVMVVELQTAYEPDPAIWDTGFSKRKTPKVA